MLLSKKKHVTGYSKKKPVNEYNLIPRRHFLFSFANVEHRRRISKEFRTRKSWEKKRRKSFGIGWKVFWNWVENILEFEWKVFYNWVQYFAIGYNILQLCTIFCN